MLRAKFFRSRWTATGWFAIMCFLFFLPGSALPKENWLTAIHFDKWVHVGLFAVLLFLFRSAWNCRLNYYALVLLLFALAYGFLVELIQKAWVPNRDFDLWDVAADMSGSVLGLLIWAGVYKKNKPL